MTAAVSTSETSVKFHQTTLCNIPEDSHLRGDTTFGKMYADRTKHIGWPRVENSWFKQCPHYYTVVKIEF
jgi:hypothetical protein